MKVKFRRFFNCLFKEAVQSFFNRAPLIFRFPVIFFKILCVNQLYWSVKRQEDLFFAQVLLGSYFLYTV